MNEKKILQNFLRLERFSIPPFLHLTYPLLRPPPLSNENTRIARTHLLGAELALLLILVKPAAKKMQLPEKERKITERKERMGGWGEERVKGKEEDQG